MFKRFLSKKGVSPLIATVLLVMIVVSIGAAVMVVIQGLAQEGIESTENQKDIIKCVNEVELDPVKVGNNYRICLQRFVDNSTIFAVNLENKGLMDVSDFKVVVFADTIQTIENSVGVNRGEYLSVKFNFTNLIGEIDKIKIYPKITGGPRSSIIACDEPNLEWNSEQIKYFQNCTNTTWEDNLPVYSSS